MTIDIQNLQLILNRLQERNPDKPLSADLISSLRDGCIPRLFSSTLLDIRNCHYEYLFTKAIRKWLKIDDPKGRLTTIVINALQQLTEKEIETFLKLLSK